MPEGQLLADRLEDSEAWQVQQLVTYHARIIDECSIWQCICGWTRHSRVGCHPHRRWALDVRYDPAGKEHWRHHAVKVVTKFHWTPTRGTLRRTRSDNGSRDIGRSQAIIRTRGANHFFFFNDTATTEIYTLSLHDALPIFCAAKTNADMVPISTVVRSPSRAEDRKSTRLNSSHVEISYAVFCLKKKKK